MPSGPPAAKFYPLAQTSGYTTARTECHRPITKYLAEAGQVHAGHKSFLQQMPFFLLSSRVFTTRCHNNSDATIPNKRKNKSKEKTRNGVQSKRSHDAKDPRP